MTSADNKKHSFAGRLFSFLLYDTYGNISGAAFIICVLSGLLLIIPFDIKDPFNSTALILLNNPAAALTRNIHYWSAQLFLIAVMLHILDHFIKGSEVKLKSGVWLRLTISILFIFYVMLSGFILKADADSTQAWRILSTISKGIPYIGESFSRFFMGSENDFQIIYVNHIALSTIFLIIIIFEHVKTIWVSIKSFLITLLIILPVSFFLTPVLKNGYEAVVKGPWYFLGLQELLHWLTDPLFALIPVSLFLIIIYVIPRLPLRISGKLRIGIFNIVIFYFMVCVFAYFFRGENWKITVPWKNDFNDVRFGMVNAFSAPHKGEIPFVLNQKEGCLICHSNMKGFSPSHEPQAIGCFSCHSGDPFTLDKDAAHKGMIKIPGNLADAARTCGIAQCHPGITDRVKNSLMNTMSGVVSVDKYVFGEIEEPNGYFRIAETGSSPAENHLRNLCASCHLGNIKKSYGAIDELSRGGGCNACHLNYSKQALAGLNDLTKNLSGNKTAYHPSLSVNVSDDHCFGCHSRSGRISTNYQGWHETDLLPEEAGNETRYRILQDERVFIKEASDIHHTGGMECIDCHVSVELMGDGTKYQHKEQQVKIACTDCHSDRKFTIRTSELDSESRKIFELRNYENQEMILTNSGIPLVNTYFTGKDSAWLMTKSKSKKLYLKPPVLVCTAGAHSNLSCNTCHTSWVPQCTGCHTEYKSDAESYDLLVNTDIKGAWVETPDKFYSGVPVMGVRQRNDGKKVIDNFINGMILSIDGKNYGSGAGVIFKRLFAPGFSHTIQKGSRSCESCHNNPEALGYGRGEMDFRITDNTGRWYFTPNSMHSKFDGLPEDAWTGFLSDRKKDFSTRTNVRMLNVEEQKRILTVGTCLICHEEKSSVMQRSLFEWETVLGERSRECVMPEW